MTGRDGVCFGFSGESEASMRGGLNRCEFVKELYR